MSESPMSQSGQLSAGSDSSAASQNDWLLERWVRLAELGFEMGVTLQMSGLLVSGTLIGARRYLESQRADVLAELAHRGLPIPVVQKLDHAFQYDLEAIAEADDREHTEKESADIARQFIHMKNARFIVGGGREQGPVLPYWRGRLARVDAFFLGTLRHIAG